MKRADREAPNLFKYSPNTARSSTRILLSTEASSDWELRTRDFSQAFVSYEYDLPQEVFIAPPKETNRPREELQRLPKPLYGLPESSLLWFATFAGHLGSEVKMECDPGEPCLLYKIVPGYSPSAVEFLTIQIDDNLYTGTLSFLKEKLAQAHRFPTKPFSNIGPEPV